MDDVSTRSGTRAGIATIGTELVTGEITNSNGTWLARALTAMGVDVVLVAALPDDAECIARFVERERIAVDVLIVSGGLGGTPDDVTRGAIARAFGVESHLDVAVEAALRSAHDHTATFADTWSRTPSGSRPIYGERGGAPGFVIENVIALPGVPSEMRAMFAAVKRELTGGPLPRTWRCVLSTTEDRLLPYLEELARAHREVTVGSYPRFDAGFGEVEVVLRATEESVLVAAIAVVERAVQTDEIVILLRES
jgi:molybdenum cofactor synthesis domain-containing protein